MGDERVPDRASIMAALRVLPARLGVARKDLPKVLSPVLRKLWHIEDHDEPAVIQVKSAWQLKQLILTAGDQNDQEAMRFRFNVTDHEDVSKELLGERLRLHYLKYQGKSAKTSERKMDELLPAYADSLIRKPPRPTPADVVAAARTKTPITVTATPEAPEEHVSRNHKKKIPLLRSELVISGAIALVVLIVLILILTNDTPSAQAPPPSTSPSTPKAVSEGAPTTLAVKEASPKEGLLRTASGNVPLVQGEQLFSAYRLYFMHTPERRNTRLAVTAVGGLDGSPRMSRLRGLIKMDNGPCGPVDVVVMVGFSKVQRTIDDNNELDLSKDLSLIENGETITIETALLKADGCSYSILGLSDLGLDPVES